MRLIILLLTALWYESANFGQVQAEVHSNVRVIPKRFNKFTKRQEDLGYLEQCSILQFWDKQIGRVNVLAFFDSTWQFSHRQAAMLRVLRERFDKTGFENIQFFAINASPDEAQYIDRSEIEVEEETWKQISPSEAEGLPPVVVSSEALVETLGPDVYFIQDDEQLQIWSKLRAFRDQILVIDRCGRLTYQVIVPWSILHFPYVKAAILSTYKDEPCGHCQFQEPFEEITTENNDMSSTQQESSTLAYKTYNTEMELTSEKPTTTITETENYYTEQISEEPSTLIAQTEYDNTKESFENPSIFNVKTENNDTLSITEESSTLADQTENTSDFDTTTNAYDLTTQNLSDDDYLNNTSNEYADNDSNFTSTADFEPTTKSLETFIIEIVDKVDVENVTELHSSETEIPTTTENLNLSIDNEEPRLKDADVIESLDARDVLKSRSTNARSVSPNANSQNRLEVIEINSESSSKQSSLESEYLLPIRIIMRAPHVDEYSDRSMKTHEYLVLKTGQPEYHEHLDPSKENFKSDTSESVHRSVRKKSEAIRRTFGKDESPGLYGEVADYWRNFGNEQLHDNTEASAEDDEDLEQESSLEEDVTLKPTALSLNKEKSTTENSYQSASIVPAEEIEFDGKIYDHNSDFNEEVDVVDEEAKSKLIAHYSKLLPWLYYVLAK